MTVALVKDTYLPTRYLEQLKSNSVEEDQKFHHQTLSKSKGKIGIIPEEEFFSATADA